MWNTPNILQNSTLKNSFKESNVYIKNLSKRKLGYIKTAGFVKAGQKLSLYGILRKQDKFSMIKSLNLFLFILNMKTGNLYSSKK